ncbi:hypothetical protein ACHMXB_21290 (plasmid) [Arthrobacter sp. UC242_113]|uniref:hypothetical protein n=1 Tax=Arthrobacter sp. UC242_113 TaxID=3374550 RepID=UPI003756F80E
MTYMKLGKIAAVAVSVGATTAVLAMAGAPVASASASTTIADQLAGSDPRDATNCGEYTCTTYYNRTSTRVWAEDLPPILETTDALSGIFCGALTGRFHWLAGIAAGLGCDLASKTDLHEVAFQAQLAQAANGCLEIEKADGKIIRIGYTTHDDWCGGS